MNRSVAIRAFVTSAAIAAVSCCSQIVRAETLSPTPDSATIAAADSKTLVASLGMAAPADGPAVISEAVLREIASATDTVAYHAGLATPSSGTQVVRAASGMGFGFTSVPFESFLTVAAAPNGENVVRTFIIIENEKKAEAADSSIGKAAGEDLVSKFTINTVRTTTSGSATLSILQVPPTSSSLVFTNVILKDGPVVTK